MCPPFPDKTIPLTVSDLPLIDRLYLSNLPREKQKPEELLARLLNEALILSVGLRDEQPEAHLSPGMLAGIIRTHWSKIAPLAHAIHGKPDHQPMEVLSGLVNIADKLHEYTGNRMLSVETARWLTSAGWSLTRWHP